MCVEFMHTLHKYILKTTLIYIFIYNTHTETYGIQRDNFLYIIIKNKFIIVLKYKHTTHLKLKTYGIGPPIYIFISKLIRLNFIYKYFFLSSLFIIMNIIWYILVWSVQK